MGDASFAPLTQSTSEETRSLPFRNNHFELQIVDVNSGQIPAAPSPTSKMQSTLDMYPPPLSDSYFRPADLLAPSETNWREILLVKDDQTYETSTLRPPRLHHRRKSRRDLDRTIKILTLNCWGLKYISKSTTERIRHIAEEIAEENYDIVCLQELWQSAHWKTLKDVVRDVLPHSKFYYSGCFGSGLAILSKYPILETDMRPYTLNGRPQAFYRGDWFVGKGVASAVISHPILNRKIQVFNTHMHAPYHEKVDTYLCHRTAQAWDMTKLLRGSIDRGFLTFATGDFNSVPGSLVHRMLTTRLADSFITLNPSLPLLPSDTDEMTPEELVSIYGVTCDSPLNTWRLKQAPSMRSKRLDYMFHDSQVTPLLVDVVFREPIKGVGCSPSDHFGLSCVYTLTSYTLRDAVEVNNPLTQSDYAEIQQLLEWYKSREQRHSHLRLLHFWTSVPALVIIYSALLFAKPVRWQFCLGLLGLVTGITGLFAGLVGAVFGWWELNGLMEFGDEIEQARELEKARISI